METTQNLEGKRVRLIRMEDPYTKLKEGDEGTINRVNPLGDLEVEWDNGSRLNLITSVDEFELLESKSKFIRKFFEFVQNSTESTSFINSKLEELEDMVVGFSEGRNLMYEWKNKNDHNIIITYQVNGLSTKFELDLVENTLRKAEDGETVMKKNIDSVDNGLALIEKEIQKDLRIYESYQKESDEFELIWNELQEWMIKKTSEKKPERLKENFLMICRDSDLTNKEKSEKISAYLDLSVDLNGKYEELIELISELIGN